MKHYTAVVVQDRFYVLARSAFNLYKDLLLLEIYAIMTYCAFSKILKKHDKVTGRNTRSAFMDSMVSGANFSDTSQLQQMIRECEERYNEASSHLQQAGKKALQEDEFLFLEMVSQMNKDAVVVAQEEGAPAVTRRAAYEKVAFSQEVKSEETTETREKSQFSSPSDMISAKQADRLKTADDCATEESGAKCAPR